MLEANWDAPANVHAFTTLRFGAGSSQAPFDSFNLGNARAVDGDDPVVVARNRGELVERASLPSSPCWLRQVHGTRVLRFGVGAGAETHPHPGPPLEGEGAKAGAGAEPEADAAVTATPGVVLAILTADCLPVVLAARAGNEVGVAHAGWRGLAAGVLEETVAAMNTVPADLVAWLGPAAGPGAYEIGEEVFDAFVARDSRAQAAFTATRPGHWRIDMYELARQRLADAGVTAVHGGGLCTISDPRRFFSHRRDGRSGRIATLAWIA
jgi:YfiH family protein